MDQIAIHTGLAATSIAAIISNDLPVSAATDAGVIITRQGSDYCISTWAQSYIVGGDGEITKIEG